MASGERTVAANRCGGVAGLLEVAAPNDENSLMLPPPAPSPLVLLLLLLPPPPPSKTMPENMII